MKIDNDTDYGKIAYIKVNELENNVRINKKNVNKNTQNIANIRNEISGGIDVTQLQNEVNTLSASVSTAQTSISSNTTQIATNKQNIKTNTNNINSINSQINNINSSISNIDNTLISINTQISSHDQDLSTLAQESSENSENISVNAESIQSISSDIESIQSDITSLNSQISNISEEISLGVVDTTTNQDIDGEKTFLDDVIVQSSNNDDRGIKITDNSDTMITYIKGNASTKSTTFNSNEYYFRNANDTENGIVISPNQSIHSETNNSIDLGTQTQQFKNLFLSGYLSDGNNSISINEVSELKGKRFIIDGVIHYYNKIFESGQIPGQSNSVDIIFMISNVSYSNFYRDGMVIYQLTYTVSIGEESTLLFKRIAGNSMFDEYLYINYVKNPVSENDACFEIYFKKPYSDFLTFHFVMLKNTTLNSPYKLNYNFYENVYADDVIESLGETVCAKDIVNSDYVSTGSEWQNITGVKKFNFIEIDDGGGLVAKPNNSSNYSNLMTIDSTKISIGGDIWHTITLNGSKFQPQLTDSVDLGNSTNKWKDLYISGTAHINGNLSDGTNVVSIAEMRSMIESSGELDYVAKFTDRIAVLHTGTQTSRRIKFQLLPSKKYNFKYNIKLYSDNTPKKYRINFYIDDKIVLYDDVTTSNSDTFIFDFDYIANSEMIFTWVEFVPTNEQHSLSVEYINVNVSGLEVHTATPKGQFQFSRNREKLSATFCNCRDICYIEDIAGGVDIPSTFTDVVYSEENLNPNAVYFCGDKYELVDGVIQNVEGNPFIYFSGRESGKSSCIYRIDTDSVVYNFDPLVPLEHNYYIFDSVQACYQGAACGVLIEIARTSIANYLRYVYFDYNGKTSTPSAGGVVNSAFSRENKPLNIKIINEAGISYFDSDVPRTSYYPTMEFLIAYDGKILFMNTMHRWANETMLFENAYLCEGDAAFGFYTDCDRTQLVVFVFDYNGKNYKKFYNRTDVSFGTSSSSSVYSNQLWEYVGEVEIDFDCDNMYLLYGKIYYEYEGKIFIKDDTYALST